MKQWRLNPCTWEGFRRYRVTLFIAIRYFFSAKSTNAVNVLTLVSLLGIAVVAMSMVCITSIFNGFEHFTTEMFTSYTPDYRLERKDGTPFSRKKLPMIKEGGSVLVTQATVVYEGNIQVVRLLGVDSLFLETTDLKSCLIEGDFVITDTPSTAVIGVGVASIVGARSHSSELFKVILPKRAGRSSPLLPATMFGTHSFYLEGVFQTSQSEDQTDVFLSISTLRKMLYYEDEEVSYLTLKADNPALETLKHHIPEGFQLLDRFQQHPEVYRVLRIEKWVSVMLLCFVLLLTLFSVISTLGMLIIGKAEDMRILTFLGAENQLKKDIVILESWLFSLVGTVVGVSVGIGLVLLQKSYGILKLSGDPIGLVLTAYPVELRIMDVLGIVLTLLLIGWGSSRMAYKIFRDRH